MIKIKLIKNSSFGKIGEIIEVNRNIAHTLIDKKEGEVYVVKIPIYQDRMMRSRK